MKILHFSRISTSDLHFFSHIFHPNGLMLDALSTLYALHKKILRWLSFTIWYCNKYTIAKCRIF